MKNIIKQDLLKFNRAEEIYKELYMANPSNYAESIRDWDHFMERYMMNAPDYIKVPLNPPSIIESEFLEKDWFPYYNRNVTAIKHARYCPPFLHQLEFIKIICVLQGSAVLFFENKEITIEKGSVCIVTHNIEHTLFSSDDDDLIINIIMKKSTFENAFSSLLMENTRIADFFWNILYNKNSNRVLLFECCNDRDISQIVFDLYQEIYYQEYPSNILMKSYVMLFFGYIQRYYRENTTHLGKIYEKQKNLPMLIRYMKENKDWITLSALAKHFKLSEGYLSRYIRTETGYTFSYLLRDLRMKQAAEMLKNSTCSIETIIEAVGYTDNSRFYRNFKDIYGMTPTTYRNNDK